MPNRMNVLTRLEADWFGPAPASRLGFLRVIVGSFLVWTLLDRWTDVAAMGANNPFTPVGLVRMLPVRLSPDLLAGVQGLTLALAALWTLGLAWRVTAPLFALAFLYWGSYRLSFGVLTHGLHLVSLHVLAFAFVPAAAALSLDARLPVPRWLTWAPGPPEGSGHYAWPTRMLCLITTSTYVLAGIAKVNVPRGGWATGENLLDQIAYTVLVRDLYQTGEASIVIDVLFQWPAIITVAAMFSLFLELAAPLAVLHRRLALAWVVSILGMHAGIATVMGITFAYQTYGFAFLSFFAVERLLPARWR